MEAGSGFLLALAIGAYCYRNAAADETAFRTAAIAAGAGACVVLTVLFVSMVVLAPGSANVEFGNEVVGVVLAILGTAIVGAIGALSLEKLQTLA
ncbi:hypothetical protein GCM10028857_09360 [Salinarchaeum chitinilyticum]